jgi:hypothetical protein
MRFNCLDWVEIGEQGRGVAYESDYQLNLLAITNFYPFFGINSFCG